MRNPRAVFSKVKLDQVLNLSELALASGYDRGVLSRMNLPLLAGKISLSDFRRILRRRQLLIESYVINGQSVPPSDGKIMQLPAVASSPVDGDSLRATVDRFYAPSSKRLKPAASRPAQESQLHSTA